jgi:uncharacterized protein (DUF1697 family)
MPVVTALLRAVNLAGHNKISMDALRRLCESAGLENPRTYVQSGNVLFRTTRRDLRKLAKDLENCIEKSSGFRTDVILRTSSQLREVVAANPFADRVGIEPAKLLVVFLATALPKAVREQVQAIKTNPEELRVTEQELYIYFPEGIGRSKLQLKPIEKQMRIAGTARNWNTVTKLLALAEEMEEPRV